MHLFQSHFIVQKPPNSERILIYPGALPGFCKISSQPKLRQSGTGTDVSAVTSPLRKQGTEGEVLVVHVPASGGGSEGVGKPHGLRVRALVSFRADGRQNMRVLPVKQWGNFSSHPTGCQTPTLSIPFLQTSEDFYWERPQTVVCLFL